MRAPRSPRRDADRLELLAHPAGADAEHEPALAQDVERGDLGGERDRVAVGSTNTLVPSPTRSVTPAIIDSVTSGSSHCMPGSSRPRCPSAGTDTRSRARRAARRDARPRPSRSRAARRPVATGQQHLLAVVEADVRKRDADAHRPTLREPVSRARGTGQTGLIPNAACPWGTRRIELGKDAGRQPMSGCIGERSRTQTQRRIRSVSQGCGNLESIV